MTQWAHLPNSHHIDWVIESVKQNPKLWGALWDAEQMSASTGATTGRLAAMWALRRMSRDAALAAERYDALDAALNVARGVSSTAARDMMWSPLLALVAYDDCDQYINMGYEKLRVYAILSEKPQAIMLLPMVYVREKLNESMVTLT